MKPTPPSRNDWLTELQKLSEHKGEGMTTEEMKEHYKIGLNKVRALLQQAHKLGWLYVDYRTETRWDGMIRKFKVFSVRKPK